MRFFIAGTLLLTVRAAIADPCGMVQPPRLTPAGNIPLVRAGVQETYVFFKDGIESFVIRPAYRGRVRDFGMLVPVPSVPAIRKVPNDVFAQIDAAIKPPPYVLDLRERDPEFRGQGGFAALSPYGKPAVKVVRKETIGMYEAVVLKAANGDALRRWMTDHGYRFPRGMESTCNDYIKQKWCFVAVKARIQRRRPLQPSPGQRSVSLDKSPNALNGFLQAMGFRFRTKRLVLPMRLSAFNRVDTKQNKSETIPNRIYVLAEKPVRVNFVGAGVVKAQIPGTWIARNLIQPRKFVTYGVNSFEARRRAEEIRRNRDPDGVNGVAMRLFVWDILAAKTNRLSLPHEAIEKQIAEINETLGLRGDVISTISDDAVKISQNRQIIGLLDELKPMTLSIIEHHFPRKFLAQRNLTFSPYKMGTPRKADFLTPAKPAGPFDAARYRPPVRERNSSVFARPRQP